MPVLWVGFGQAGGKIANTLQAMNKRIYRTIAVNTEEADLGGLMNIREKVLIGKYALKGRGVGANIDLGAEITQKALSQIMDRIDEVGHSLEPEAYWVLAGLAGGTGAGGAYVLANELKKTHKLPVYGVGVIPSVTGMPPEKEAMSLANALKSFELWSHYFDNTLLVDNQQYEQDVVTQESVEEMYNRVNRDLAKRLTTVLSAAEVRPSPQEVFSSSEIRATLGHVGDVSTLGWYGERIKLKTKFWRHGIQPGTNELESIIDKSVKRSSLSFPCDVSGARSAALITCGRPEHLFSQAISKGRARLEQMTRVGKVRYGDFPDRNSKDLSAVTLVSGINDFSRLDQMKQRVEQLGWSTEIPRPSYAESAPDGAVWAL